MKRESRILIVTVTVLLVCIVFVSCATPEPLGGDSEGALLQDDNAVVFFDLDPERARDRIGLTGDELLKDIYLQKYESEPVTGSPNVPVGMLYRKSIMYNGEDATLSYQLYDRNYILSDARVFHFGYNMSKPISPEFNVLRFVDLFFAMKDEIIQQYGEPSNESMKLEYGLNNQVEYKYLENEDVYEYVDRDLITQWLVDESIITDRKEFSVNCKWIFGENEIDLQMNLRERDDGYVLSTGYSWFAKDYLNG